MKTYRMLAGLVTVVAALALLAPAAVRAQGTVIASDNFNRPDEAPFATSGNWGRVVAGNYDGVSNLTGNEVTSVSNEGIYYWRGTGTFDNARQFARQRVVQKDGELGLVLLGGTDHAIMVGWGPPGVGSTVYIYWYSNGVDRGQLATGPSTLANGDTIEAVLDNGVIYAKVNGVTVKSVANTTTLTSGTPGFITYLDPNLPTQISILDDWEAGTPASYTISGTITEDAVGLSGVLVNASGGFTGSTTTDGSGYYTITGVPPSATSILLTPTLSGHTMSPLTRTVAGPVTGDIGGQDFTSAVNNGALLTIHATHGNVTKDPDQTTYTLGTDVTLTPVPDAGYAFVGWSGDVPSGHESDNPLLVTMNQDRVITATFSTPGLVASDDFNRTNETPLTLGGNWQQPFGGGSVNLTNNQIAGAGGEALYYWQGAGTFDNANQFARLRVVQASGQVGLVLLGASNQALVTAWNAGTLYIYWYSGGSYHGNLTTTASTLQNGDIVEALLEGGVVYAKINGNVVASVANSTTLSSGRPGFETYQTGAVADDWEAGSGQSYTISGTITENAVGLSGVLVTASGGASGIATTNGNGDYTITGVPANAVSILLTPTLSGHTMSPVTRTVTGPVTGNISGEDFTSTLDTNTIAADNFDRPDELPLAVGGNWVQPFGGGFDNLTNHHVVSVAGEALYYWQGGGTFDNTRQYARARVVQAAGQVGVLLLGGTNRALVVSWGGGRLYIYWYLNGSHQGELANEPSILHDGDSIEAVLENGLIHAKINGVTVKTVANTTSLTSGRPGFETYLSGAALDDWEGGTPAAYTISGTILENATGLSGVLVTASGGWSGTATTNSNGDYALTGVLDGATSIVLTPTLAGHTMSPLTRTVTGPVTADVSGEDFTSTLDSDATLTLLATHGSVTRDPDQPTYAFGTDVTLTPVPDTDYHFAGWSGDVPAGHETDDPLVVTMDRDRTITASFVAADVVAWDSFNRADESPLAVGGNWQQPFSGGFDNLLDHHVAGVSGEALYYWQGPGTFHDTKQFARATVVQSGGQVGLVLLGASNQALVVAWHDGTLYFYWYSGGSYRGNLTTTASTLHDGDVVEALLDGGIVYAKINGSVVASVANTTTLSSGKPGFETYLAGASFDDWEAGPPPPSPDTQCPDVLVSSPNGGQELLIGSNVDLQWSASDNVGVTCVDLLLSRDGVGGPYEPIATCIANTGSYNWTVSDPPTTQAILKVVGHDAATNACDDTSDDEFTIRHLAVPVLLADFHVNTLDDGIELRWTLRETASPSRMVVARGDGAAGPFEALAGTNVRLEGRESVCLDRSAKAGRTYWYRLTAITPSGERIGFEPLAATMLAVAAFALPVVEPNPMRGPALVRFAVPIATHVRLSVLDVQGRRIATLVDRDYRMGRYEVTWRGQDDAGQMASSGVYFIRLEAPGQSLVRRVVFLH